MIGRLYILFIICLFLHQSCSTVHTNMNQSTLETEVRKMLADLNKKNVDRFVVLTEYGFVDTKVLIIWEDNKNLKSIEIKGKKNSNVYKKNSHTINLSMKDLSVFFDFRGWSDFKVKFENNCNSELLHTYNIRLQMIASDATQEDVNFKSSCLQEIKKDDKYSFLIGLI